MLHCRSLLLSGEAFLCSARTALPVEHLIFAADAAVPPFPAGTAICRTRDGEAAAPAAPAGRRFMEGALAAVRALIQYMHSSPPFRRRDRAARAQPRQTQRRTSDTYCSSCS